MLVVDCEKTGIKIKETFKNSGYKVKEICKMLNISQVAVYNWFRGKYIPSIDNLVTISEICNIPINELIVTRKTDW